MAFGLVRGLVGGGVVGLLIGWGRGMLRGGRLMVSGGGLVIRRGRNFIESRSSGCSVGVCVMGGGRGVGMRVMSTSAMPVVMVVTAISQANSYQQREDYLQEKNC